MIRFTCILILLLSTVFAFTQDKHTFTGKVTDRYGVPLEGVCVLNLSDKEKVITDSLGQFSIEAHLNDKLFINDPCFYHTSTKLRKIKTIHFVLYPKDTEKYVEVGYGKMKKESMVSSVSTISGEEITRMYTGAYLDNELNSITGVITVNNNRRIGCIY